MLKTKQEVIPNPLAPKSDKHLIYPCYIGPESNMKL